MSNEADPNKETQDKIETVRGGRSITVTNADGTSVGEVFVRKIPFLDMDVLLKAYGKPLREIIAYTGMEEAAIRSLSDESQAELWEAGREVNSFLFSKFLVQQSATMKTMEGMLPSVGKTKEAFQAVIEDAVKSLAKEDQIRASS